MILKPKGEMKGSAITGAKRVLIYGLGLVVPHMILYCRKRFCGILSGYVALDFFE